MQFDISEVFFPSKLCFLAQYSGTFLNGHLPIVATSLMQPLDVVLIEALLIQYLRILPNADSLLFHKADRFFGRSSTWTVQNSLDNADTGMPLTQDCPAPLIDSTTGHYNSTGTHSTSLWLVFLTSIQQGRALECAQRHEYTLPHLPE